MSFYICVCFTSFCSTYVCSSNFFYLGFILHLHLIRRGKSTHALLSFTIPSGSVAWHSTEVSGDQARAEQLSVVRTPPKVCLFTTELNNIQACESLRRRPCMPSIPWVSIFKTKKLVSAGTWKARQQMQLIKLARTNSTRILIVFKKVCLIYCYARSGKH